MNNYRDYLIKKHQENTAVCVFLLSLDEREVQKKYEQGFHFWGHTIDRTEIAVTPDVMEVYEQEAYFWICDDEELDFENPVFCNEHHRFYSL